MVSYDDEQRSQEVRLAVARMIPAMNSTNTAWVGGRQVTMQDVFARNQLALLASAMPLASIGTCSDDGTDLRFVGGPDGLRVCCTGNPQHCWKIG